MRSKTVFLAPSLHQQTKVAAVQRGITLTQFVEVALCEYLTAQPTQVPLTVEPLVTSPAVAPEQAPAVSQVEQPLVTEPTVQTLSADAVLAYVGQLATGEGGKDPEPAKPFAIDEEGRGGAS